MYIFENQTIITEDNKTMNLMDKSIFPNIGNVSLDDIFLLDNIDEKYREKNFYYDFNGLKVPRVSHILKECIYNEGLMYWAARVGKDEMKRIKDEALRTGSAVHSLIENFLLTGTDKQDLFIKKELLTPVFTAYSNFKAWILAMQNMGYYIEEVVAIELPVTCHLYGGTIDCILKINGKYYIVDFKTSKSITYDYVFQTCSYKWIVDNHFAPANIPHIDGIGIIRVDKEIEKFEDYFLTESVPYQREIIDQFYNAWGSMLSWYYHNISIKQLFSSYKKNYNIQNVLGEVK